PVTEGYVGQLYSYQVSAFDPQNEPYSYGFVGPSWLSMDLNTGLIKGTPTATGVYSVTVQVVDDLNVLYQYQSYQIVVQNPAVKPPVITSGTPPALAKVTQQYSFTFTATDPANLSLTWSLSAGTFPTGMSINSTTGVLTWTPTATGSYSPTVVVTNSSGGV